MNKSDTIGKLALALSKTQKEIKGAVKDSTNPFFKATYADLSSVWEACREQLAKNELSVIQTLDVCENGVIVETTLAHSSGEWISGRVQLNPTKNDPQGIGSAITYGRRYALAAIVGICPEDDDANAASGHNKKPTDGSSKGRTTGLDPVNAGSIPAPSTNIDNADIPYPKDVLIKRIEEFKSVHEGRNWKTKHQAEIDSLSGDEKSEVMDAYFLKLKEFK